MVSFQFTKIHPIIFSPDDASMLTGDPLDEARSTIDRNIARLEESIRALKSRRNELSPISRLPVEMLANIFKFSLTEDDSYWQARRPESWTNFSQVSQHWRFSALSAPGLWTNIPVNYPRWAQEMLERSKMANLTIRYRYPFEPAAPTTIETVRSCLSEMNRVEKIEFTQTPELILEKYFRDLPKSAPQLHSLCIMPYSQQVFSIHEDFLYDTERLQHVELFNCKISWDSRLLTGLTHLYLENSLMENSSIIQVLHALQRMPALTVLHLDDSIPDDSVGVSTCVVDLPYLRELNLSSDIGPLTTVLHHINFPPSAKLDLTCINNQSTQIDFSNFFSVLTTRFLSSLVIRSLCFARFRLLRNPPTGIILMDNHTHSGLLSTFPIFSVSGTTGLEMAPVAAPQLREGFDLCVQCHEFGFSHPITTIYHELFH